MSGRPSLVQGAVTMDGDKVFVKFVQRATGDARAITNFLRSLKDRGFDLIRAELDEIEPVGGR